MSVDQLASIVNSLPYAQVMWSGQDEKVLTVLTRINPSQEMNFEQLAFKWMAGLHRSKLLVAKQLVNWEGRKGYLWNISLFSNDHVSALRALGESVGHNIAEPTGPYVPPHLAKKMELRGDQYESVEARDSRVHHTIQEDSYTEEKIRAEKRQGDFKMFTVPLRAGGMRNIPRAGSTKGAHSWSGKRPGG